MGIQVITLWPPETECVLCEKWCYLEYSLPMYEGEIVPDDYEGQWGGMPVCKECFKEHRPEYIEKYIDPRQLLFAFKAVA